MDVYNQTLDKHYSFENALRIMSYGFIKTFAREKLRNTASFMVEMFSQLCLAAQQVFPVNMKDYKKRDVSTTSNGLVICKVRRKIMEEKVKVLPVLEDPRLIVKIVEYMHSTHDGDKNLSIGASKASNYIYPYGIYCKRLYEHFSTTIGTCWL